MEYFGEHLWVGKLGELLVTLGFVSAIVAALSSLFNLQKQNNQLLLQSKISFLMHGFSVFAIIGLIFYMMINHFYEYQYVWSHVSDELPFKYIFSAFWEGQEGSFLLWMFWHVILGLVVVWKSDKFEPGVIAVISIMEIILISMLLGRYFDFGFTDFKIGTNPFALLRNETQDTLFNNPDYLKFIKGTGLNPLLQNYWMTIHPPTLFLGFASTIIPFAYAFSGYARKDFRDWIHPALSWSLFSGATLGLGILMGGAWAYEALSFGGYWAWDPVENMSLVPWLMMIGGIHTAFIAKNTGRSLNATYWMFAISFILILYSSFLTRSGVLGDTSVHAFTEMGLETQLLLMVLTFIGVSSTMFFVRRKEVPSFKKEESIYSREFWLFIGSLVFVFSSVLISFTTSIPVYNKIFGWINEITGIDTSGLIKTAPTDPIAHYNKYQIWIGILLCLFSALTLWLRYRDNEYSDRWKLFLKRLIFALGFSAIMTYLTTVWLDNLYIWFHLLLTFSAYLTIYLSVDYAIAMFRYNKKVLSSSIAHFGLGLMMIGIIASGVDKRIISKSYTSQGIIEAPEGEIQNNLLLYKGLPDAMDDYVLTYVSDTTMNHMRVFTVDYGRVNTEGDIVEQFQLKPNILYDKNKTKIEASNPGTKRYLHKDVFTHISALAMTQMAPMMQDDTLKYDSYKVKLGDSIIVDKYVIKINTINPNPEHRFLPPFKQVAAALNTTVYRINRDGKISPPREAIPIYYLIADKEKNIPADLADWNLRLRFSKIDPVNEGFTLDVTKHLPNDEYIVLEAIVFPGINLFWLGTLLMIAGLFVGMLFRIQENKRMQLS